MTPAQKEILRQMRKTLDLAQEDLERRKERVEKIRQMGKEPKDRSHD